MAGYPLHSSPFMLFYSKRQRLPRRAWCNVRMTCHALKPISVLDCDDSYIRFQYSRVEGLRFRAAAKDIFSFLA